MADFAHCIACMTRWSYKTNDTPDTCPTCGEPGVIPEEGDDNVIYFTRMADGHILFECPGSDSYPIVGKLDGLAEGASTAVTTSDSAEGVTASNPRAGGSGSAPSRPASPPPLVPCTRCGLDWLSHEHPCGDTPEVSA